MRTRLPKLSEPVGKGSVTLVGAGPGDPELLTVKAIRAMQSADIILFDSLVSDEILSFARKEAKRMLVGKRGHRPSCRQDAINALILKLARQGKHVVRLKSGDPVMFGRAGEEISHLRAAGITVAVVPGVTSASAMASRLGVSLTHREQSHSARFVTGHAKDGGVPEDVDWRGLADAGTTLLIYMGGRTGRAIADRLIENGLSRDTPCVIAISVSRRDEKHRFGTVGDLAAGTLDSTSHEPVLIGIGKVFAAAVETSVEQNFAIADRDAIRHCQNLHLPDKHANESFFAKSQDLATGELKYRTGIRLNTSTALQER